jgi:murein DD-endopeptidase MepM/ murein hydrolase activator NlpD
MMSNFLWNKCRILLRLALILCLFQPLLYLGSLIPIPDHSFAASLMADQGVGGGSHIEEVVFENDLVFAEDEELLETGVLEPESFSKPRMLQYSSYRIQRGDIIGHLATNFGLSQDTLISANGIKNSRLIQIGQVLKIPNQDGILYTVKTGDTLSAIAQKYESDPAAIIIANELFSDKIRSGGALFIPGARLNWVERQEINGDLFIWPISGYISSPYGYRRSPFTGNRQFHSGLDIAQVAGTPIKAAMSGRVSAVGWDDVLGNFVVVSHHSGYRTLYGHMSVIRVKSGAYVGTGERIGDVGSTGLSTGPHLHFMVYKNGVTVNPRTLMR